MAITVEFLGELARQMQADMRTIRAEIGALRDDVGTLRGELASLQLEPQAIIRAVGDLIRASETRMMDRMAAFEAYVDTRIDRREG